VRVKGVIISPAGACPPREPRRSPPTPLEAEYRRSYRRLVGLAALLTGSREVAEDLVQDTFVRAGHRVGEVDDPGTYLRTAVANACRSWHRRNALARRVGAGREPRAAMPDHLVEFDDALRSLKPEQRIAVVLRVHGGFTAEEIAVLTGSNASTVRTRISRGLAALRKVVPRD
jgi:RNA polymerase sigma factor (sigma-70 family)